jgi:hypothetical protein
LRQGDAAGATTSTAARLAVAGAPQPVPAQRQPRQLDAARTRPLAPLRDACPARRRRRVAVLEPHLQRDVGVLRRRAARRARRAAQHHRRRQQRAPPGVRPLQQRRSTAAGVDGVDVERGKGETRGPADGDRPSCQSS